MPPCCFMEEIPSNRKGEKMTNELYPIQQHYLDSYVKRINNPNSYDQILLKIIKKGSHFAKEKISLRKDLTTLPYPRKGDKGFVVDLKILSHMPEEVQTKWRGAVEQFPENCIVLLHVKHINQNALMFIPRNMLRFLKNR